MHLKSEMMGHARVWGIAAAIVAGSWTTAAAQTASDDWHVTVEPYFMGAAMSGPVTVRGHEASVDLSASQIIENLQFGVMGMVMARKGNWGFGGDAIWMALGTTVQNTNVDFSEGAFAFYGLRRLGAAADVTFGLRVNTLQGDLTFKELDRTFSQNKTWVDPIVGLVLRTPADRRVYMKLYSEIGGFGVGSDFSWQLFPTVGFKVADSFALDFGYRWLDNHYTQGEGDERFVWDVLAQGPVIGFGFHF